MSGLSEADKHRLSLCMSDTAMISKTFFPERFHLPFASAIHDKIFELIDGPANKVAIAAPRGFGKTSTVALALPARYILFGIVPFIFYINKSHDAASLQTENLKRELLSNQLIRHYFGDVRPESVDGYEEVFSKKSWVAKNTLVWPRGTGQQVRGVLHKHSRPGLFILDDIEDPNHITNPEYRKKTYEWLYADVLKAVPQVGLEALNYKVIYIDTLKHEDSVLQRLLDSPDWTSIRLEACDDDFNPTAPEFLSKEKILKEWEDYSNAGQSDIFFREMRNIPISTKDASFRDEYFRYYNFSSMGDPLVDGRDDPISDHELNNHPDVENIVVVDPAKTAKFDSADSAVVGIGMNRKSGRLYIRDIDAGKMLPDDLYERAANMGRRINARVMGWEVTGLEEFLRQPVENYMRSHGHYFELIWLRARGGHGEESGKAMRVRSLIPYYRLGQIYHNRSHTLTPALEAQLRMFPRSKRWDIMDATSYVIEMMEKGLRYFAPQTLPTPTSEDEYDSIPYDPPIEGWRWI